jgi:vacuolar protein sorting-associated protein 13A/C
MFEALISAFLESSLGQFVCLDKDQLKVGMWGGNLELQNLKIKITILDDLFTELESPAAFTLVKGVVGTLNLSFNWAKLNSVPVRIALSDIHILVRPQWGAGGWTEEQTQAFVQSRKQRLLESANRRFQVTVTSSTMILTS